MSGAWYWKRLAAPILIVEAQDVVLADVVAGLDLDHHAVDGAWIGQAVHRSGADVGGLVRTHEDLLLVAQHLGHSGNDDPMLAAMVMHLQRQAAAGPDDDALDLEARAFLQDGVRAPWPMHGSVKAHGLV